MSERARELLGTVEPWKTAVAAVVVFTLVLGAFLRFAGVPSGQQAIGQEDAGQGTTGETTDPGQLVPDFQYESLSPVELPPEPEDRFSEQYAQGIPGLAVTDVLGGLVHGAPPDPGGRAFACSGPDSRNGLVTWYCRSEGDKSPAVYEVQVVAEDPLTILSVTATAYNAPDDGAAAEFLGRVGGLLIDETDPINAEVWVRGNVPSGGDYAARGARLALYGYKGARVLEVVATGV